MGETLRGLSIILVNLVCTTYTTSVFTLEVKRSSFCGKRLGSAIYFLERYLNFIPIF